VIPSLTLLYQDINAKIFHSYLYADLILGRYKQYTFEEIHQKIVEMDELFCTENLLNQLMQHTPTPDEVSYN